MQRKIKKIPVKSIIIFDISAQKLIKIVSIPRKISKPPKTTTNPIKTTICIKSFFLLGTYKAKREKNNIQTPIKEGM